MQESTTPHAAPEPVIDLSAAESIDGDHPYTAAEHILDLAA